MKKSTAAERAIQKNLEILQAHGIDFGKPLEETKHELLAAGAEVVQSRSEILEATLASVRKPGDFSYRQCIRCGETFGADYKSVGYCSDNCRMADLFDITGVRYLPRKSEVERWGGEPPMIIPPKVLKVMVPYAERILELAAALKKKEQTQESSASVSWEQLELFSVAQTVVNGYPQGDYRPPTDSPVTTNPRLPLGKVTPFSFQGKAAASPLE